MRRRGNIAVLAAAAAVLCAGALADAGAAAALPVAGSPGSAAPGMQWGRAEEVPGLGALNAGGNAVVLSVSCWRPGDCAAGGFYTDGAGKRQAFVTGEAGGRWGRAEEAPGTAELNVGAGGAQVSSVSCAPDGSCAAGGYYSTTLSGNLQAFVVSKRNGHWGTAETVPGTAALNVGGFAQVLSVSCTLGLNCAAGGFYQLHNPPGTGYNAFEAFVVSEKNGRWGKAEEVPGLAPLNPTPNPEAFTQSVSCPSAGNCLAGGFWFDVRANEHPFVVTEKNGRWSRLVKVKAGGGVSAVSCRSAGNCAAGGGGTSQGFVVSERNGRWDTPRLRGVVMSVSCASAADCAAGGLTGYDGAGLPEKGFVLSERNGRWSSGFDLPGLPERGAVSSISCPAAGNCGAGGYYFTGNYNSNPSPLWGAFVVGQRNGRWATAEVPPGLEALNLGGNAQVNSVSCASVGTCTAGGSYTDAAAHSQGFVDGTR